ncbi:hypothetical protein GJ496_007460 [Pomphorhynchus laevis]|nr:hypothetical protein GJ496_007460 [Pomphorhynchus laevis]
MLSTIAISFLFGELSLYFDNFQFKRDHFTTNNFVIKGVDKVRSFYFYNVSHLIFDSRQFANLRYVRLKNTTITDTHFPLIAIANTSMHRGSFTHIDRPEEIKMIHFGGTENFELISLLAFSSLKELEFNGVKFNEVYIPRSVMFIESNDNHDANIQTIVFDNKDNFTCQSHNRSITISCPGKDKAIPEILTVNGNQFSVITTNISYGHNSNMKCIKICT